MTRVAIIVALMALPRLAGAHCEVPCGIYGDEQRIITLREHFTTIEKAMKQIETLGAAKKPNYNQIVRWVTTKDHHASEVQHIVSQYFLTQRIKVPAGKDLTAYHQQLARLHELLVVAMKTKQGTDLGHVAEGRRLIDAFAKAYFSPEALKHLEAHH